LELTVLDDLAGAGGTKSFFKGAKGGEEFLHSGLAHHLGACNFVGFRVGPRIVEVRKNLLCKATLLTLQAGEFAFELLLPKSPLSARREALIGSKGLLRGKEFERGQFRIGRLLLIG